MATKQIPLINGVAYSWGDIVMTIGGVPVSGITAIEYEDKQEVVNHYGAGRLPVSRSKGKITATAKLTLMMEEVVSLQAQTSTGRLQDIAPFPIVVSYLPEDGQVVTDKIIGCQFTSNARKWKEGDALQAVELELVPAYIEWSK